MQNNDYSRKMKDISFDGATFNGNSNFQGDANTQTYQVPLDSKFEQLFLDLKAEIEKLTDSQERNDNLSDLATIKGCVQENKLDRAKKFFGLLSEAIKVTSAGAALATSLGISL
ncbi:hypothetical protein [Paenibacillus aceti]|uniref:Uncharacterized protein n=1 Tax=Paenibacillus aceti TaxID=1820010 RepID=A0ABQ1VRF7_9BACL|nr:hypothetical protein [Paenibacillus aceti]GGF87053.1 hypothetical protein GCM10010913_05670 [Paenibacillus aceti]